MKHPDSQWPTHPYKVPSRRALWKPILGSVFGLLIAFYGSVIAYYRHAETSIVFTPLRATESLAPEFAVHAKEVFLRSRDGTNLDGWVLPAEGATKLWIYFLHGAGGNAESCQLWWSTAHAAGANFFVLDYRGYGKSDGMPSEDGMYDDARAGYEYLRTNLLAEPENIILYGHSLGSAVAIELASKVLVAGLIVEGALISLPARGQELYPFLPVGLIARNRFDSLEKIPAVACPKLFLHARDDHVIPIRHGRVLFEHALPPKEFVELNGDHGNAIEVDQEKARTAIKLFLEEIEARADTRISRRNQSSAGPRRLDRPQLLRKEADWRLKPSDSGMAQSAVEQRSR